MHTWAASIVSKEIREDGWLTDLRLPAAVSSVTGGTLDLYLPGRVVDYKFPGDWSWKRILKGYRPPAYIAQLQVYGLGASLLGLPVEHVGLLVLPPNDKFEDALYDEWLYDEQIAREHLAAAEEHATHADDRDAYLASTDIADDFCGGCQAFLAGRCKGYTVETKGIDVGFSGLTFER